MITNNGKDLIQLEDLVAENFMVAMIQQEPTELSNLHNIEFIESYDDVDYLVYATLRLSLPFEGQVCLVRHQSSPAAGIEICVHHNQPDIAGVLYNVLRQIDLSIRDLTWVHPEYKQELTDRLAEHCQPEAAVISSVH
jgi:hypothetical protein